MTREKEIENKAIEKSAEYRFGQLYSYNNDVYSGFIQGAQWADKNPQSPWIRVKDNLPCNHEELMSAKCETKKVFVLKDSFGNPDVDYMIKENGRWKWFSYSSVKFWFPVPEPPKE